MKEFISKSHQDRKLVENVLAVSNKARAAKAKNPAIINATAGSYYDEDGNIKVFNCVKENFENPNYNNVLSYSSVQGSKTFRQEVIKWIMGQDYQINYPNYLFNAIATPGGTGALMLAMGTYLDENETILLPDIMWPSYIQIANSLKLNVDTYQLFDENGHFNLDNIKKQALIQQQKDGKVALIINDPCHNPTGFVMTKNDYEGLIKILNDLAEKTKVVLILDVAYIDYSDHEGEKTRSYFQLLKALSSNVMVLFTFSASKTFGIYGLRLGALIQMTSLENEAKLFNDCCSYLARSTWSNASHLGMEIVENTLSNDQKRQAFKAELHQASCNLAKRATLFINKLNEYHVPYAPYQNGFFVLILVNNETFEKEIEEAGAYGCHFGNYYRVALASLNLEEAIRLGEIIGKAYQKIK